jgi:hypothetical protein
LRRSASSPPRAHRPAMMAGADELVMDR